MGTLITATERKQRARHVKGGDWDDAVIFLEDGRRLYSQRAFMLDGVRVRFVTDADGTIDVHLGDVTRVVR